MWRRPKGERGKNEGTPNFWVITSKFGCVTATMKSVMAFVSYYYMSACSEIAVVDVDLGARTLNHP